MRFRILLNIDSCTKRPMIVPVPGATAPGIDPRVTLHRVEHEPDDEIEMWVDADEAPPLGRDCYGAIVGWDQTWTVQVDSGLKRNVATIDLPIVRLRRWEYVMDKYR